MVGIVRLALITVALLAPFARTAAALPPAPVPQTGQALCFDSLNTVVPCAGTGQDPDIRSGVAWPSPRFSDHGDGTVSDNLTGLMWTKGASAPGPPACQPGTEKTWSGALDYAACLNANSYLGYSDWRVPTIRELGALIDLARTNPPLPADHPFTGPFGYYWTSTSTPGAGDAAWRVIMSSGWLTSRVGDQGKDGLNNVWPVRDGSAAAPAPVPETGQTVSYGPGDDGALRPGVPWPSPRFSDNGDGTVTDNLTGLAWLKNANCNETLGGIAKTGTLSWYHALTWSNNLASGSCGLSDGSDAGEWHLPDKNELWSLVNYGSSATTGHPFSSVQSGKYWSSSSYPTGAGKYAWFVYLSGTVYIDIKTEGSSVWPVRSGRAWSFGPLRLATQASTDLGQVALTSSAAREIRIRNRGAGSLAIASITTTGTDAAQFRVSPGGSNPCSSLRPTLAPLAPLASCTVLATFAPTSIGPKSANLTVAAEGVTGNVPLTGSGYSTVLGTVTDYSTALPLAGVTVTLSDGRTLVTSASGAFNFGSNLPNGSYSATAVKTGYQSTSLGNLSVSTSSSGRADFWLPPVGPLNVPAQQAAPASPGQPYSYRVKTAGGTYPYHYALAWGSLPAGLSLEAATGVISGTPAAGSAGSYAFAVAVNDAALPVPGSAETQLTLDVASPLSLTTAALLPNGAVAAPYSGTITASGGRAPYTFARTSGKLPAGMSLTKGGILGGTPSATGISRFTVTVTDAAARAVSLSFTLQVVPQLLVTTSRLNDAIANHDYATTLAATGGEGPYHWSVISGSLPSGFGLDASTGTISGRSAVASTGVVTIAARDAADRTASRAFTFNVAAPLAIASTTLPDAPVGAPYARQVTVSGGLPPFSFSHANQLPPGLSLDSSTGIISGIPAAAGLVNLEIRVTDSTWPTAQSATRALPLRSVVSISAMQPQIASGGHHSVALKDDGTVWSWGLNTNGQLGDGTTTARTTPVRALGLSGVIAIAAGSLHTMALKSDGTVWGCGNNSYGLLGDGTTSNRTTPVRVTGLSGVVAIAAGNYHTLALKSDGTVWSWGRNANGQLGDGSTVARSLPVPVPGLSGVAAIAAGGYHSVALMHDGTVRSWGENGTGQLGDGSNTQRNSAVAVSGLSGVASIAAGHYHTLAVRNDGTAWSWGRNANGQLGDGTTIPRRAPVAVQGISAVAALKAGLGFTVALKNDGRVWTWGANDYGQLGNGSDAPQNLLPVLVSTLSGNVAVGAKGYHALALQFDGSVWAWGDNSFGKLGDGTTAARDLPVPVGGAGSAFNLKTRQGPQVLLGTATQIGQRGHVEFSVWGPGEVAFCWKSSLNDSFVFFYDSQLALTRAPVSESMQCRTVRIEGASEHRLVWLHYNSPDDNRAWLDQVVWTADYFETATPGVPVLPTSSATGFYDVYWAASPSGSAIYQLQEATDRAFTENLRTVSSGPATSAAVTLRAAGTTYYYRIRATSAGYRPSPWVEGVYGVSTATPLTVIAPGAPVVPAASATGSYPVSWSKTPIQTTIYELEEATDPAFSVGLRLAYRGTGNSVQINGRASGSYYYRIRGTRSGYNPSSWVVGANGCAVTLTVAPPGPPVVPATSSSGSYPVTWPKSVTWGTIYELEEATNPSFTANLRQAFRGTANSTTVTGRATGTYYYRVRGTRSGHLPSSYAVGANGCIVTVPGGKTLTVTMSGSGSGTVTSSPAGISCLSGSCSYSFPTNQDVNLLKTASIGSLFSGWSGACSGNGACSVLMDADQAVTATFTSPLPAKIGGSYYQSLQAAYDAAQSGATIMLKEGAQPGGFRADSGKSVTASGGYDPSYSGSGAESFIQGGVRLRQGKVVFDNVRVR